MLDESKQHGYFISLSSWTLILCELPPTPLSYFWSGWLMAAKAMKLEHQPYSVASSHRPHLVLVTEPCWPHVWTNCGMFLALKFFTRHWLNVWQKLTVELLGLNSSLNAFNLKFSFFKRYRTIWTTYFSVSFDSLYLKVTGPLHLN